jgi:hypothetical protein
VIQKWQPPELLDLHGYVTPTLIEATTKPHNPSIEYDLWLKWNQARIDANEAAMNAEEFQVTVRSTTGAPTDPFLKVVFATTERPGSGRHGPKAGTTGARSIPRCTPSTWG